MRVTPIRPIARTARTLARRTPTLPQRNLSNDRDHRSLTDHRKPSNNRCPSGNGVYIDLEV
jgi:hypothetical protein